MYEYVLYFLTFSAFLYISLMMFLRLSLNIFGPYKFGIFQKKVLFKWIFFLFLTIYFYRMNCETSLCVFILISIYWFWSLIDTYSIFCWKFLLYAVFFLFLIKSVLKLVRVFSHGFTSFKLIYIQTLFQSVADSFIATQYVVVIITPEIRWILFYILYILVTVTILFWLHFFLPLTFFLFNSLLKIAKAFHQKRWDISRRLSEGLAFAMPPRMDGGMRIWHITRIYNYTPFLIHCCDTSLILGNKEWKPPRSKTTIQGEVEVGVLRPFCPK